VAIPQEGVKEEKNETKKKFEKLLTQYYFFVNLFFKKEEKNHGNNHTGNINLDLVKLERRYLIVKHQDIENYLHDKLTNNIITSKHSVRSYRTKLKAWLEFCDGKDDGKDLGGKALEYRDFLTRSKNSTQVKTTLYILKDFYKYMDLSLNPFEKIVSDFKVNPKEKNRKRIERDVRVLTETQVQSMINYAYRKYHEEANNKNAMKVYIAYRNYFIVKMLAEYGMRIGALVAIDLSDIKINDNMIMIYESKNKQPYPVPILKLKTIIIEYINIRATILRSNIVDKNAFLLASTGKRLTDTSARRAINNIANALGFYEPQKSTHQLRHYRATCYYKQGMSIDLISMIMGVSPTVLKQTYFHMTKFDIVDQYEQWLANKDKPYEEVIRCPKCGYQQTKEGEKTNPPLKIVKNS
jgi:site-specific recombinase XerD